MAVDIYASERPLAPDELERAEKTLGVSLPEDYKRFLLAHNGGRPRPDAFRITWKGQPFAPGWRVSAVGDFHAIYEGDAVNLLVDARKFKDRIPKEMLPVATDPGSNLVLLGLAGANRGKVFFWIHELEEEFDERSFDNLGLLANSFDEFLDSLFES
jgi:cell wall assembly regulator SMI1